MPRNKPLNANPKDMNQPRNYRPCYKQLEPTVFDILFNYEDIEDEEQETLEFLGIKKN